MGLVIFGAFALYLIVSIVVVIVAGRAARKRGRSPWRWGGGAALAMYLLLFWDHIPTVIAHKYYCEKEAGFWIYKTVEQWKAENLGVTETLSMSKRAPPFRQGNIENYTDTYSLNQHLNWVVKKTGPLLLNRWRWEKEVVDTKTNDVLVRYVDFSTGSGFLGGPPRSLKFWLQSDHCSGGRSNMYSMDAFVGNLSKRLKSNNK